tara:strand:+ start:38 stop:343 length:306 start_codon:yes stop_codon:yes gene_type:complete
MKLRKNINLIIILFLIFSNLLFAKINYDLFTEYTTSDGKTKALFGLQYIKYYYVIYIFVVEVFVFIFILISNKNKKIIAFSLLLLILSSVLIFIEPWKWFI